MTTYNADDRRTFEEQSLPLYEEILAQQGVAGSDPRIGEAGEWARGFRLLRDLGLVQFHAEEERWVAEEPATAQARVVAPLSHEGSRLISESSEWSRVFGTLTQAWRRTPEPTTGGPFTYLRREAINPYIAGLVAECEEEILTAQPQAAAGRRANMDLSGALSRDLEALQRGCRMRTLYQHSARRSRPIRDYVAAVGEYDAEVRTLDEFFNRMIVIDRRVALIPNQEDMSVAVVVRERAVVAYLVDIFERSWERGRPFTSRDISQVKEIALEQRAMTIRMLIGGHADQVSAKRMGVSPRTYAGYIADLKDEYDVATRFQLGYLMGQAGISGREATDE